MPNGGREFRDSTIVRVNRGYTQLIIIAWIKYNTLIETISFNLAKQSIAVIFASVWTAHWPEGQFVYNIYIHKLYIILS